MERVEGESPVKLAEFNALCDREWSKRDRGGRGDVVSLTLTEAGAEELKRDVLISPQQFGPLLISEEDLRSPIGRVVNPITRTPVRIRTKPDGRRETARVCVMGGTYRSTWWPAST
jgi:hypothetical protein